MVSSVSICSTASGTELKGKKLGILAFGNVGRNVARIAAGFGMEVYAYDAFCPKEVIEAAGVKAVDCQDALFETCDVVSLHIPATAETKQSINAALVGKMKKGAILINTARKEVINEPELLKLMAERTDIKYITDIKPDEDVKKAVEKLIAERVPENDTKEVKKFLLGSVELTTLKTTDSDESVLKFTEKVNEFEEKSPFPSRILLTITLPSRPALAAI